MNDQPQWQPTANLEALKTRARLLQDIRAFFAQRQVLEVETPLLSHGGNTDPHIESFSTIEPYWLRTSPEFPLKRLLAAGYGDIYELGRVFRKEEAGRFHNPEFTILEWYRNGWHYHQLMDEVEDLVRYTGQGYFSEWPRQRFTYRDLFLHHLSLDPFLSSTRELQHCAHTHGLSSHDHQDWNSQQWLDLLLTVIQNQLPEQALTFVCDFPVEQAALAKIRMDQSPVAERFELYLGRQELANGYQELTNSEEQVQRFKNDLARRQSENISLPAIDHQFLAALEHQLPECSGVALGVDRLLMTLCDARHIQEVISFPFDRA